MADRSGVIVLMGSGELTSTMVEVHKALLAGLPGPTNAVFIDTPAGFQMNVDEISAKAVDYFRDRVKHPLSIASYKSRTLTPPHDAEKAFHTLRSADFILVGPGSPTYAAKQFANTPIPRIIVERIRAGACMAAASAAALTMGRFTLPVYEMYKVGEAPHWTEGVDILGHFGFNMVVIPHWNNAEGGTHDTRFCFIGDLRFRQLERMLPQGTSVLGVDEHTACIMDLGAETFEIRGNGTATLRNAQGEQVFETGKQYPLSILKEESAEDKPHASGIQPSDPTSHKASLTTSARMEKLQTLFRQAMEENRPENAISALLELERAIWKAAGCGKERPLITRSRERLREMIFHMGTHLEKQPKDTVSCMAPLVENLLDLRQQFRENRQWAESDAIRDALTKSGIHVEDTETGYQWCLAED